MLKTIKLLTKESVLIILLSLLSLFTGMLPTIYRYAVTPKDRVFAGTEFYSDDYSIYVSNILQGMNSRWTLLDKHTSEPHKATIIHNEYLLWGKLTGLFGIHQVLSFHLARLVFGAIFLILTYFLLLQIFPKNLPLSGQNSRLRKLTFFLITLSGGFPIVSNNPDFFSKWHLSWLSEIDLIARTTVLPHYLLGYIFFILAGVFLLKSIQGKQNSIRNLLIAIISGISLAFVHPVNLVTLNTTLLIYLALYFFLKVYQNINLNIKYTILYIIKPSLHIVSFFLLTTPILIYYKSQFNVIPWNHMSEWENITSYYPDIAALKEYALAIGPTFFLGIIGIFIFFCGETKKFLPLTKNPLWRRIQNFCRELLKAKSAKFLLPASETTTVTLNKNHCFIAGEYWQKNFVLEPNPNTNKENFPVLAQPLARKFSWVTRAKENYLIFLISWTLAFFSLIYFSYPLLHISQVRFMQNPIFIPFSIFSAIALINLTKWLSSLYALFFKKPASQIFSKFLILNSSFLILLSLSTAYFSLLAKLNYYSNLETRIYPTKKQVKSYNWLKNNTNPEDVVLASYEAGNLIPFLSGNTVYAGHQWATLNWPEKSKKVEIFFSGQLGNKEAKKFLKEGRIKYVFYGYQEQGMSGNIQKYSFLTKVFQNQASTIFKFD